MNSFRGRHPKTPAFGGRGTQHNSNLPNPWLTDDEIANMRRQNLQFSSYVPNRMQLLNQQPMMSTLNKNYPESNVCKMSNISFNQEPNPNVFESVPTVSKSAYPNRFPSERFHNADSFSNVNIPYRQNEGSGKDFHLPHSMPNTCRNDPYFDPVSKPLHSNVRQQQDRYSCMQSDQNQFQSSSPMFQNKDFPFINEKSLLPSNNDPFCNKVPNSVASFSGNSRPHKAANLFPAYTPKENLPVISDSKSVQLPAYNSDFIEKPSSFDQTPQISASYTKTTLSNDEKVYHEKALEKAIDELLQSNSSFSTFEKSSFKGISDCPQPFDEIVPTESVSCAKSNFPFASSASQEPCFQTSKSVPFQSSQSLPTNQLSATSSQSCFMQNTQFSSETEVHQSLKESISSTNSFNFESSISATDIADLLPGIDAFVETLSKPEEMASKLEDQKNCSAFSFGVTWPKPAIPFIGDSHISNNSGATVLKDDVYQDNSIPLNEKFQEKLQSQKNSDSGLTESLQENKSIENVQTESSEKKSTKAQSALEEAVDLLVNNDAIVGLDYIIEYKKNINQKGSFPFKCTLCNSAISRPTIIDHIIGPKHRIRYLKIKDERKYEEIKSLKVDRTAKDAKVAEASFELEKLYGRGHVIVDLEESAKSESSNTQNSFTDEEKEEPVTVFTLDKIPIGFEALSPDHDDHSSSFILEPCENQETSVPEKVKEEKTITTEPVKETTPSKNAENEKFALPGLDLKSSENDEPSSIFSQADVVSSVNNPVAKTEPESSIQHPDGPVQIKRSASPDSAQSTKHQKVSDATDSLKMIADTLTDQIAKVQSEKNVNKSFDLKHIEELSKCVISSDEEADFTLQAVNVLIQMFLRYKLQHVSLDVLENMMKGLQSGSPVNVEELLFLLKKDKPDDSKENICPKSEDVPVEKVKQDAPINATEVLPQATNMNDLSSCNAVLPNNNAPSTISTASALTLPASASTSTCNIPDYAASSSISLNPPPFFNWPQVNNPVQNAVSYAATVGVAGNQNMMWTAAAFQPTQAQFGQMSFYGPQSYGNVHPRNQVFQNQYPVLAQNNMQMNPPLPPPLPPLPPSPCNPPLPPMPGDLMSSHSVHMPNNPLSHFSNPPPPPPPPLS